MTPAEFDQCWWLAATTTAARDQAIDVDWLLHEATGLVIHPHDDLDDPLAGKAEWIR